MLLDVWLDVYIEEKEWDCAQFSELVCEWNAFIVCNGDILKMWKGLNVLNELKRFRELNGFCGESIGMFEVLL